MTTRQVGSGTATGEANACAEILAAHFAGDNAGLLQAKKDFASAQGRRHDKGAGGRRGFSADRISSLLEQVPRALGLAVRSAQACGPGAAGDVLVECQQGHAVRIEIKAQLTLPDFSWIQSADWVREETDFLGELLAIDPAARDVLSADVRDAIVGSYTKEVGWDLGALWVADIAGVTNGRTRRRLGVLTPRHMATFLENKYFVHITMEGLRLFRLSEVPNLLSALNGGLRYKLMPPLNASSLRIRTRGDGQAPRHGGIHLTYFLGQRDRPVGGHHVHAPFFDGAEPRIWATASTHESSHAPDE